MKKLSIIWWYIKRFFKWVKAPKSIEKYTNLEISARATWDYLRRTNKNLLAAEIDFKTYEDRLDSDWQDACISLFDKWMTDPCFEDRLNSIKVTHLLRRGDLAGIKKLKRTTRYKGGYLTGAIPTAVAGQAISSNAASQTFKKALPLMVGFAAVGLVVYLMKKKR